ncbi:MAG: FAD-binding protein [Acetobacteraceae bacterium]|nr:FAD-binding protein [Acetobacteraceae bacterium]
MHAPALVRSRRVGDAAIADRLRRETEAEVLWSEADRGRYATDASIFQVEPVGVVVPRTQRDVAATIAIAREEGVPVLARGGGTSQCGQTVNAAIVIDCTKHLRRLIGTEGDTVTVEPGIVLAHLNAAVRGSGRFFPVDPSTHLRCTIGGMAGNNSCGSKSIVHGLMADNVAAIEAILADGTEARFAENADAPSVLLDRLRAIGAAEASEIAARFPRQLRRVGGYNLDTLIPDRARNLARLLVGSEGTLAFSSRLTLKLAPIKPRKVLGICQFRTFRAAMEAARHLVTLKPEAVELVDATMIALGRSIPIFAATIEAMVSGEPAALLIVEFHGFEDQPLLAKLAELDAMMADLGHPDAVVRATDPKFQAGIAEVREAGLNIMMSMKGDGKPVSFIEDCAVDLEHLADYTERLEAVFRRHGTSGTWYAHASVGCLHVRPVLNMKDAADIRKMRAIAEECFALVREYKGSHSGEHGDGIVRSEFHEAMFGPRIARAFEAVKDAFDPGGLFNPGRIVRPPRMDDRSLFRYHPGYAPIAGFTPALDWSAHPGPLGGMLGAVEMCNNNGACRKFDADVMCPSYRATRDEAHLTRGRANTLRLALSGQLGPDAMASDALAEAMQLCVSCKGCRRECPTGIDMAKMKIEVLHARARRHGIGLRERMIGALPSLAPWLSRLGPVLELPAAARLAQKWLGFAEGRSLPRWSRNPFHDREAEHAGAGVILFADSFNRWFEPENLRAAMRVLGAGGFRVRAAASDAIRPLCCGRTWLAAGQVGRARAEARRTLAALAVSDEPVIGLEPSCVMTLRDEFLSLLPGEESRHLAGRALLLSEFLVREAKAGRPVPAMRPMAITAHIHGHCHQKAFGAFPSAVDALRAIPGLRVNPIAASCCGMAGAFGYQAETAEISRAMAELALLPAVRAAADGDIIVADGTSCRHQIADLAGREAVHSVRVMEQTLA